MFGVIEAVNQQLRKYGTPMSTLYYILVVVFRAAVVFTFGKEAYGDEKKDFQCNQKYVLSCIEACYNSFNPIRHISYWEFQIVLISCSTVFFHLYATYEQSQIAKVKDAEEELKKRSQEDYKPKHDPQMDKQLLKLNKKKKALGNFKEKAVLNNSHELDTVNTNRKIRIAFFLSLLVRFAAEIFFTFVGTYEMFTVEDDGENLNSGSLSNFLAMKVPEKFVCDANKDPIVKYHCPSASVKKTLCFVPRANEKTFMLRYMNALSCICLIISFAEICHVVLKHFFGFRTRHEMENNNKEPDSSNEDLPVPPYNNEMHHQWEQRSIEETPYKKEILEYKAPVASRSQMSHHSKALSHVSVPVSHHSQATGRHSITSARNSKKLPKN